MTSIPQALIPILVDSEEWRFGVDKSGKVYVVAQDIMNALGYSKTVDAEHVRSLLDPEESGPMICGVRSSNGVYQNREMLVIYEDGIWELIFRSTLPGAKVIKKQIKEILREIRETGGYISRNISLEQLARIREAADYKIVRHLITRAKDYDPRHHQTRMYFAKIQNSFLRSVSGFNAEELKSCREIVTYKGKNGPTKEDLSVAKNYLNKDELEDLGANVAVVVATIYRDLRRRSYTMAEFMRTVGKALEY